MFIATPTVTLALLSLSVVQLGRWRSARHTAHDRGEDIYFVPALMVYFVAALLAAGTLALMWWAYRQAGTSPYGWGYYTSAVLCAGLCFSASLDARRTFIRIEGDELIMQSLARRRQVSIRDIERVMILKGSIALRLHSGRVMLASNVLGWNAALCARLRLL
jgi:hypothetical protein